MTATHHHTITASQDVNRTIVAMGLADQLQHLVRNMSPDVTEKARIGIVLGAAQRNEDNDGFWQVLAEQAKKAHRIKRANYLPSPATRTATIAVLARRLDESDKDPFRGLGGM